MKKSTYVLSLVLILMLTIPMVGCGKDTTKATEKESAVVPATTAETTKENVVDVTTAETTKENEVAAGPEGDIVDGALATKENPVPLGTWAAIYISDGGWPKPAHARIINVSVDQTQTLALIDEYNTKNPNDQIIDLAEHTEFLDYILVEYEVCFPADFTDSDTIMFSGLILRRENNQEDWIASDGSNYYWMGSEEVIDAPTKETGYPENGDTITCTVVYPMIKGYTDYTLHYQERNEDLSATIDTYFAID